VLTDPPEGYAVAVRVAYENWMISIVVDANSVLYTSGKDTSTVTVPVDTPLLTVNVLVLRVA